eukprot:TRINITY_DN36814_c0_g1_i1.p1 TRINITY_DN36814_c0_g1~~TRINITY_DN36814_c0_g1_i1.p1  ORF type:complete len:259 (+),score=57.04 TRINITY_DN36814_c0_g1_i1:56-832(+)
MSSIRCEAMSVLQDLKVSFEQLYEDIHQYEQHSKSIGAKLDICKGVIGGMGLGNEHPVDNNSHQIDMTPPPTRSGPPPIYHTDVNVENIEEHDDDGVEVSPVHDQLTSDITDKTVCSTRSALEQEVQDAIDESEELMKVAIIKEEASERESIIVAEKSSSSKLADELDEIQIIAWQTRTKSNSDLSNSQAANHPTTPDIQTILINSGEWKSKVDPRTGNSYFYMTSNKKKRVWNLRKYAEAEIAAGRMDRQGNTIEVS